MARYIDADALKREIVDFKVKLCPENRDYGVGYFSALSVVEGMLACAPTLTLDDLRPHGYWVGVEADGYADGVPVYNLWQCSECGEEVDGEDVPDTHPFCHGCGADMRGGGE